GDDLPDADPGPAAGGHGGGCGRRHGGPPVRGRHRRHDQFHAAGAGGGAGGVLADRERPRQVRAHQASLTGFAAGRPRRALTADDIRAPGAGKPGRLPAPDARPGYGRAGTAKSGISPVSACMKAFMSATSSSGSSVFSISWAMTRMASSRVAT